VRFTIDQRIARSPDDAIDALTDPDLYAAMVGLARVDRPEVLGVEEDGEATVVRVRYRFIADLPSAARAVIDPARLTWVDETRYDRAARTASTRLLPDHYPDRLTASATSRFDDDPHAPGGTLRRITGDLSVRAPLVAGRVERAIVEGLEEHLGDEARLVAAHQRTG
jgi:hypothetical protein